MKILLIILCLFIPNIYAKDEAISCSYKANGSTINFGYYITSSGENVVTNFVVDGESYPYYYNHISSTDKLTCPTIGEVSFYADNNKHYFIVKDREQFNLLLAAGEIIRNDEGEIIGQVNNIINPDKINQISYTHYDTSELTASSEVSNETRKQMEINVEAYQKGVCTYKEKYGIYDYFNKNDFNSLSTFYGDNVFKYEDEYIKLSDECAKIANDLYVSVVALRHVLSDYVDGGGNVNTMNFLSLQSEYYIGYSALNSPWFDNKVSEDACDAISGDIRTILNSFFDIFRLVSIILAIFFIYLDGMKCLTSKDDSNTKKWITNSFKRLIILVIVLLLPFIVNLVLDLINRYTAGTFVKVNGECVKAITGG